MGVYIHWVRNSYYSHQKSPQQSLDLFLAAHLPNILSNLKGAYEQDTGARKFQRIVPWLRNSDGKFYKTTSDENSTKRRNKRKQRAI